MAQQEEGWPLGLQPLNARVGLGRNGDFSGSISFNTLITGSPTCSTDSSSDLDTESTGSFFHDKSITLGSLIGVTSILELSRRSLRGRKTEASKENKNKTKSRTWLFSLCTKNSSTDVVESGSNDAPSLGHFLAVERKATNGCRRNESPVIYGPDELALAQPGTGQNSLFVDGRVAPPQLSPSSGTDLGRRRNGGLDNGIGRGFSMLFSCMCEQSSH